MSAIIYRVTNTLNSKIYIGKTTQLLKQRWYQHCSEARNGKQTHLYRAIRKYGESVFMIETLEVVTDVSLLNEREIHWIAELAPHYNMTAGGEGIVGFKHSSHTREQMRQRVLGEKNPIYGSPRSEETRRKLSEAQTGKTHSEETRAKMRIDRKGRPKPEGFGAKISAAHKGRVISEEARRKMSESAKRRCQNYSPEERERRMKILRTKRHPKSSV
jgi:group I intron endonuclease